MHSPSNQESAANINDDENDFDVSSSSSSSGDEVAQPPLIVVNNTSVLPLSQGQFSSQSFKRSRASLHRQTNESSHPASANSFRRQAMKNDSSDEDDEVAASELGSEIRQSVLEDGDAPNEEGSSLLALATTSSPPSKPANIKFELVLLFCLLLLISGPSYFVYKLVHSDFRYHQACVECFASGNNVVFNHSSHECQFYNGSSSENSSVLVYSPEFCGAPECQSKVLIGNVRPVPYWMAVAFTVLGIVISIIVNFLKDILQPLKSAYYRACGWKPPEPDRITKLANGDIPGSTDQMNLFADSVRSFGVVDPYYYLFLYCLTVAHFVYVVVEVCTNHRVYGEYSAWKKYESVYSLWLNSGTISVLLFAPAQMFLLAILMDLRDDRKVNYIREFSQVVAFPLASFGKYGRMIHLFPPLLIPFACTHAIPGMLAFVYVFMALAMGCLTVYTMAILPVLCTVSRFGLYWGFLFARVCGTFLFLCLIQTTGNYAILFYQHPDAFSIVGTEWTSRNTKCYTNALMNDLEIYNVALAGFIFS